MTGKCKYSLLCMALAFVVNARSQVSINFNASLYGRNLDGLAFTQLINSSSQPAYVKIKVVITEISQGKVAVVQVPYFQLKTGTSTISYQNFSKSSLTFSTNPLALQLSRTGRLGDGEFEFCFEVTVADPKTLAVLDISEFCFQSQVSPLTPLILIDPAPTDKFCNTRPNFTWQPPMPLQRDTRFRIVVCEKNDKQTDIEAITYNLPVINISGLYVNNLFYPPKTPDLKKGHTYVWQVTAYQDKTILTKSEIWQFEIKCEEEKETPGSDSYRELTGTEDGNYYIADRILRISFNNPYNAGILNYSITAMAAPEKKIKKLPELKLNAGLNKYAIDLSEINSFKNGEEYMITVRLENNRILKLRFTYKE